MILLLQQQKSEKAFDCCQQSRCGGIGTVVTKVTQSESPRVPLKSTGIYDWHSLVLSPVPFSRGGKITWKLAFEIIAKI